ncbi:D-aminoacyl-tRNA deacylase [Persicobacter sp. CCB-QB2]|uniref:D-aminoacyl-tRNA deacylase n=1 Tax=Persicobacter sp. CCB-QB2 TaxID=1561025 RepID=UPI0006A9EFD9|nr:D-aminoacyl-tRNA deacylase [Persicobacter sp. CCB-QB2]
MRVLIQRAKDAHITADGVDKGGFAQGLVVFIGIENEDGQEDIQWLVNKIINLRIFGDEEGKMNRSVLDIGGDIMLVSQFTLHASTKKGNRPSFINAAKPDQAIPLYETFIKQTEGALGKPVFTGEFGADMQVSLTNDGPVTIWIDSKNRA